MKFAKIIIATIIVCLFLASCNTVGSGETALGKALCDATLVMAGSYCIVSFAAVILAFVFRTKKKTKASIWTHAIAFAYIAIVLAVNSLADKFL